MATTMRLIAKTVLGSDTATVTFSNIPATYTDLYAVCSVRSTRSVGTSDGMLMQFNDSTSSYSWRWLLGSNASSSSGSDATAGVINQATDTADSFSSCEFYIPNYAGSTNKSWSGISGQEKNATASDGPLLIAGLWSNTQAITSILFKTSGSNWKTNSSFYLYGITKMDDGEKGYFGTAATGGDEVYTTGNGYKVHVFKNSGTLNVTAPGEVEYLVVGGGGGGGGRAGGGGGAGGYRTGLILLGSSNYSIQVGAGGLGATDNQIASTAGNNTPGTDSIISAIYAIGGGRGGGTTNPTPSVGGSGGGGHADSISGASGISGQGNSGGNGANAASSYGGGGGGGAGGAGTNGSSTFAGNGGPGMTTSFSGVSTSYAGGGGGGAYTGTAGTASAGGGAGSNSNTKATSGTANTGGGGGGGGTAISGAGAGGGNGGSGIVIIRYRI